MEEMMGIFKKSSKKAGPNVVSSSGGKISMLQTCKQSNIQLSPHRCDVCNSTFMLGSQMLNVFTDDKSRWHVDIGGYCPTCRKFMCQKHIDLANPSNDGFNYVLTCNSCGSEIKAVQ
jgi:hypothetical protein